MLSDRLSAAQTLIQDHLDAALAEYGATPVAQAMGYAVSGGKRVRGFLALESAALYDVAPEQAIFAASAVEAVHAYSLVHDDLPAMDDDDLRRGLPTVHVKWDEATAILVGDALHSFGFALLADQRLGSAEVRIALSGSLAEAAGARGMVLGQAQDIAAETAEMPLSLEDVTVLQANKTGKLIEWPALAGAVMVQADPDPLRRYARAIGLAFQIADDILDVEGDTDKAGKRLQKDSSAGKATFVSLLGLEAARGRARDLVEEAQDALSTFGERSETLRQLAKYIVSRDH